MKDNNVNEAITNSTEKKEKRELKNDIFDWGEALVKALLIIILVFTFAVRIITVSGTSMLPTLHEGDYLLVSDLFYKPDAGDIVVITKREAMEKAIVKRIVATEFQTVDIDFSAGKVYVDGEESDASFTYTPTTEKGDINFPVTVPEGHVFVLGDNRNGSTDSRFSVFGMIDERHIVGRALLRILPIWDFKILN